jgi:hypothetical protein
MTDQDGLGRRSQDQLVLKLTRALLVIQYQQAPMPTCLLVIPARRAIYSSGFEQARLSVPPDDKQFIITNTSLHAGPWSTATLLVTAVAGRTCPLHTMPVCVVLVGRR